MKNQGPAIDNSIDSVISSPKTIDKSQHVQEPPALIKF